MRVLLIGSTGFIGGHVQRALTSRGVTVSTAPGLRVDPVAESDVESAVAADSPTYRRLCESVQGVDAVVNSAGNPGATSGRWEDLMAANAVLPGVVGRAARAAGVGRYVQVSSAAVQGRRSRIDESMETDAFSPYAQSKALGEVLALRHGPTPGTVVYRPHGVHAPKRGVSRAATRIARSSLASVAGSGDAPTPQSLVENVADAIAFLATTTSTPPPVVIHPWEGLSTAELLRLLGGRPRHIPTPVARTLVRLGTAVGKLVPAIGGNVRRVEMLWFGQQQADSWLTEAGWSPVAGREGWQQLGDAAVGPSA